MKTKYTQFRRTYWSYSRVSEWILPEWDDSPKTVEEWQKHTQMLLETAPIRYWIAQKGLCYLQDLVMFPVDFFVYWGHYISNRKRHSHCLCSNLTKGEFHDKVELLLHANFDALVEFVEIECALAYSVFYKNNDMKEDRRPDYGIMYLKKEIEENDGERSKAAKEVFRLYSWWTSIRPYRKDPYETTNPEYKDRMDIFNMKFILPHDEIVRLEKEYQEEDQQMLHRLIDVRMYLWV